MDSLDLKYCNEYYLCDFKYPHTRIDLNISFQTHLFTISSRRSSGTYLAPEDLF